MAGMSKRFAARTFNAAAPVVDSTPSPRPPAAPAPGGKKKRRSGSVLPFVFLALILIMLGVVLLRALPSTFTERLESLFGLGRPRTTPTTVLATPTPAPSSVAAADACLAGCALETPVPTPLAANPGAAVILYSVTPEPIAVDPMPLGYQSTYPPGFYQPVGGTACAGPAIHIVSPGDTVLGLARCYGVDPHAIVAANGLWNPDYIRVGQVLTIPCAPARWFGAS